MVASVSPSATVYDSPAASGDGLGDGLGEGDAGGGSAGLLSRAGLGDGAGAGAGVGGLPPTQPQAITSTVPTIIAWTSQRARGMESLVIIVMQPYGLSCAGATVSGQIESRS